MNISDKSTKSNLKIAIIGKGNVGSHLCKALENKMTVCLLSSRGNILIPKDTDLALICVKDSLIAEVAAKISFQTPVMAHTSGSVDMKILSPFSKSYGVLYPLQTFTKGIGMNYSDIPVFIEYSDDAAKKILADTAGLISDNVNECDSEKRKWLHLGSVFACNFTNAVMGVAEKILESQDLDFRHLYPLLEQTVKKLKTAKPLISQTGPAVRKDFTVMNTHMDLLSGNSEWQKLYSLISEIIIKNSDHDT